MLVYSIAGLVIPLFCSYIPPASSLLGCLLSILFLNGLCIIV